MKYMYYANKTESEPDCFSASEFKFIGIIKSEEHIG